ncbi:amidohydrolase [Arenibacter certesii]|uniref:Omega-amidase YafV n=1 Tax=Arenibacter certesii TaxID=228955 RepID=A0A918MIV4_9FLAO|nr:amidohydrolase [Arenibacter certesii]GGW25325.1 amidohydrolase [Arenibacter certesii]
MTDELNIALVQCNLIWENPQANRENLEKKINSIYSEVDMIVLPEMFTTGFTMTPGKIAKEEGERTVEWMQTMARKKNAALVGSIVFEEGGHYYNRLWFVEPNNEISSYDKRHTFTLAGEDKVYTAGEKKLLVSFRGFAICPLICYDLRFPVWARNTENYDVLIYVANWPEKRIVAWDTLLKARAIENMAYLVGVNRTGTDNLGNNYVGHSVVYDVLGHSLAFSEENTVLYATLNKAHIKAEREKLRFLEDRDQFILKG